MIDRLLDALEVHLGQALRHDARRRALSESTARVLLAIGPDEALPMTRVAERLGRERSTATRFVDRAEAEALVVRVAGERDRRSRWVRLAPRGLELRQALLEVRGARARGVQSALETGTGLGASQVEWFLHALAEAVAR